MQGGDSLTSCQIQEIAAEFTRTSPDNIVPVNKALRRHIAGMRIYEEPIFGYADPDDPYFESLKKPAAFLSDFMLPKEWLPSAMTVISFFLPFTRQVRDSNKRDMDWPSQEWMNARIEGQNFIGALTRHIQCRLETEGFTSVAPSYDSRFWMRSVIPNDDFTLDKAFTSNWSERHIAYACGLGTFSLSKGLITKKGVAGRFGSLLTDLELNVLPRPYKSLEEYCSHCGACINNCPVGAICIEKGKNHILCKQFLDQTRAPMPPYYGCGKCQINVPCEMGIPVIKSEI